MGSARWLGSLGLVLLVSVVAEAVGVTQEYRLEQLSDWPADVVVSPDYLTVIEFGEEIDHIASARGDLLNVEVKGNQVLVRAGSRSGATDLVVNVGGRTALFRVRIDGKAAGPQRYVVRSPEASRAARRVGEEARGGSIGPAPVVAAEEGLRLGPAGEAATVDWLRLQVMPVVREDGKLALFFELANRGTHLVMSDMSEVSVRIDGRESPGEPVVRSAAVVTGLWQKSIGQGEAQYGVIVVDRPVRGTVEVWWDLWDTDQLKRIRARWTGQLTGKAEEAGAGGRPAGQ